jgi:undecaprenyl-diphosphatase
VIVLAGGLEALEAWSSHDAVAWDAMLVGMLIAFVCAYTTIHFFLKLVERVGLFPFVVYRLALGAVLLAFVV